ncbi:hypothetical protein Syun_012346 [Stephania yunnanensis]|uniref:Uncharacterized protein n=1 Tax=Stephania yunnanensis TaxID=152371 RepID=A0AAP0PJE1_9MAGN
MAMQATGMSFSKIVLLSGAAYTASIMATNGQLADILGRLQSLSTSTFIGETIFAILIAIFGLVLFAHLIGNMQDGGKLFFRGQLIWEAVVNELMSAGMANAKHPKYLRPLMPVRLF